LPPPEFCDEIVATDRFTVVDLAIVEIDRQNQIPTASVLALEKVFPLIAAFVA
jgi:hypothetical protein